MPNIWVSLFFTEPCPNFTGSHVSSVKWPMFGNAVLHANLLPLSQRTDWTSSPWKESLEGFFHPAPASSGCSCVRTQEQHAQVPFSISVFGHHIPSLQPRVGRKQLPSGTTSLTISIFYVKLNGSNVRKWGAASTLIHKSTKVCQRLLFDPEENSHYKDHFHTDSLLFLPKKVAAAALPSGNHLWPVITLRQEWKNPRLKLRSMF